MAGGVCDEHRTGRAGLGVGGRCRRALRAGPASRRLGASLQRIHRTARLVGRRPAPLVARECEQRRGSVPVCGDGPAIEVEGRLCEHAERGYHGEQQSWLPAVCGGTAGVSARLPAGGTDGKGEGRERLDREAAQQQVWLRAASAAGMMR